MPRLRQVSRTQAPSPVVSRLYDFIFGDRDPVASPGTTGGTPGNWWTVCALVPDVLDHAVRGFRLYQSPDRLLDPSLRELAQCRVGWVVGSQFVFSQHCKSLRALSVDEAKISAIPHWAVASCFSDEERTVLAYADCLAAEGGRVPDGLFAALKAQLSDEEILELTYVSTLYVHHAIMAKALRLEFDDRPDRVVEVSSRLDGAE
ncbi:MAG: carboxymuconolactone decarboxylase family protein [Acidimicrobiales bacterium]